MAKPGRLVPRFGAGGRAAPSAGSGHGWAGPTSGVDPGAGHRTPCGWNRTAPTVRALLRSEAGEANGGVRRRRWAWNGCRRPVPSWPGRAGGAPRRLAEPSLASALSADHAPCPQHGRSLLLRTERGTRFAPSLFLCSSVMHAVRARLGPALAEPRVYRETRPPALVGWEPSQRPPGARQPSHGNAPSRRLCGT